MSNLIISALVSKDNIMAFAKRLSNNKELPNNAKIVDYQSRAIGSLENLLNTGKITRSEYKEMYAQLSKDIQVWGKQK